MTMHEYQLPDKTVVGYDDSTSVVTLNPDGSCEVRYLDGIDSKGNAVPGEIIPNSPTHMVAYAAPTPTAEELAAQEWLAYQASAKTALANSDVTVARIAEAVALGNTTWTTTDVVAYMQMRADLRAILSATQPATIPTTLPTAPYPAGT